MKFVLTVIFMALTMLVLASSEAPEGAALDTLEGAREEDCAGAYKSCDKLKCCNDRACICKHPGHQLCKCRKSTGEIVSDWWKSWG
uniref:U51-Sparatoxin-Hju1a_1 n=1 Tax=Heteropoda jugulans TaxID=1358901 RepID=A0A4Q8K6H1_9ARAC